MPGLPIDRREFLSLSARAATGLLVASCTPSGGAVTRPRQRQGATPEDIDTQWPIKRVVYLMMENRSFDNLFGRFPGVNGATAGVSFGRELPLVDCPDWLPGDLPHDHAAALKDFAGGALDGFAIGAFGPIYAYSQFSEQDIPNYYHWAREYVISDNFFASQRGPSYPNHLYSVSGSGGGTLDNPENIRVLRVAAPARLHLAGVLGVRERVRLRPVGQARPRRSRGQDPRGHRGEPAPIGVVDHPEVPAVGPPSILDRTRTQLGDRRGQRDH